MAEQRRQNKDSVRVPVERLLAGDIVKAVERGPRGRVVDADRAGWTIVEWQGAARLPYQHGKDRLYLLGGES